MQRTLQQLREQLLLEATGKTRDRTDALDGAVAQPHGRLRRRAADQRHEAFLGQDACDFLGARTPRETVQSCERRRAARRDALLEEAAQQTGMPRLEEVSDQIA